MEVGGPIREGRVLSLRCVIDEATIHAYVRATGTTPPVRNVRGQLRVPDLLLAAPLTRLADSIACELREVSLRFPAPLYAGEEVLCELTLKEVLDQGLRISLNVEGRWGTPAGRTVLEVHGRGVVTKG